MSKLRCFIAISLSKKVVQKLKNLLQRLSPPPGIRLVEPETLHLTLNFIGEVDDIETPAISKKLAEVTSLGAFELKLGGFGAFPRLDHPRVVWVGAEIGAAEATFLNRVYRDVIEDFGFTQEKRFVPHLTLARIKFSSTEGNEFCKRLQHQVENIEFEPFEVSHVTLYNSILEKQGATHIPLATIPLSDPD